MNVEHILLSFLAGLGSGFVGAATGGAGLISIPALIFLGLSPSSAIATNAFGSFGMVASAIPKYAKAKKLRWKPVLKLIPLTIAGAFLGAKALVHLHVNDSLFSVVIGVVMLLLIPIILSNPNRGIKRFKPGDERVIIGSIAYFVIAVYGGFFGAGAGIFSTYSLTYFFGMTYVEAKGSNFIPSIFLFGTSLVIFLSHHLVNFKLGIPMIIGMYIGGILGANAALKNGNKWVRTIFILVIVLTGLKLILFP
ncbi:MAG TPA: sulfite exporter TauE/SafE family protein [Candidatus Saccharimonadales bacterium]|nr:sulfite exporter TauE/SafE family protein [Candidatus Saccharimonadales bacterium]